MEIQGKVWGSTQSLFCKNNVEIHRIWGKLGGYSSKHHHVQKYNMFIVEKGRILVRIWRGNKLIDNTYVGPQQTCTIPPGVEHQFEVLESDTVAYEVYWTEIRPDDIIRANRGGMRKVHNRPIKEKHG